MTFVYRIQCSATGRLYFGVCKNPRRRWQSHLGLARRGNPAKLYAAMREALPGDFAFEILASFPTRTAALLEEARLVEAFDTVARGFNRIPGGQGAAHLQICSEARAALAREIHARRTPEQKSAIGKHMNMVLTVEQRSERGRRAAGFISAESRARRGRQMIAERTLEEAARVLAVLQKGRDEAHRRRTPEAKAALAAKMWATRRAKKEGKYVRPVA